MTDSEIALPVAEPPVPRIIPRSDHPISRQNIDREALKVMHRLRDEGFTAYLVGGAVRDLYLGKTPKDFDISTDARPGQIRKIFRNSRIIGRRFRLVQVFYRGDKVIEVSTFRSQSEEEVDANGEDEVLAQNNTFGSPVEDAFRRDLSINSLFYEIENFSIIDYTGGVDDLNSRIVRLIGDPERRIISDPARMMRVIRHAARNNFTIDDATWQAILKHRAMLTLCPVSRLRDELFKDLYGGASRAWAELALDSGLFYCLFPFFEAAIAKDQSVRADLLTALSINDRLCGEGARLPEPMLLALLLVPWARVEMNLLADRQGGEQFSFLRQFRDRLDDLLANLNIKRADKEAISGLIANLPLYWHHDQADGWPKRLTRKSYFQQGLQFFRLCKEAGGGPAVTEVALPEKPQKPPRPHAFGKGGHRTPAFGDRSRGGIFGLAKKR